MTIKDPFPWILYELSVFLGSCAKDVLDLMQKILVVCHVIV